MYEYNDSGEYQDTEERPVPVRLADPVRLPDPEASNPPSAVTDSAAYHARLKEKYGKVYRLEQSIMEDDDHDRTVVFYFKRPTIGSFDRYAKTMGQSAIRASKAFLLDCVLPESREQLERELEENPGMAMSISGKLTDLLGMSNGVNLKLL